MKSKQNNNGELQSRRDFFKNAAKAALPIIGAVMLSANPAIAKTIEATGCDYTCKTSCQNDCYGSCKYGCKTTCKGTCSGSCKNTCSYSNK